MPSIQARPFRVTQVASGRSVVKTYREISRVLSGNPDAPKVRARLRAEEVWDGPDYRIEPLPEETGLDHLTRSMNRMFMGQD